MGPVLFREINVKKINVKKRPRIDYIKQADVRCKQPCRFHMENNDIKYKHMIIFLEKKIKQIT